MRISTKDFNNFEADTVISFIFEDKKESELLDSLNKISQNELHNQIKTFSLIEGKMGENCKFAINENLKVLIFGLGKLSELTRQKFSQNVAQAMKLAKKLTKNKTIAIELINPVCNINEEDLAKITIISSRIGLYEFDKYLKNKNRIESLELICNKNTTEIDKGAQIGAYISYAMNFAKDLVNDSAQIVTPKYVAKIANDFSKDLNLEAKIYNKKQIEELNMNAFLAVGQGSDNEPMFVHLTYKPKNPPRKKIALIGKGITFDAGGLDIKPATSMLTMKSDMSGCANVLGIIQAIAKLQADVELHVLTALCENMPSGKAYKQGDVLTAMNGKTIEVDNTDAEGRITLADVLCYADKLDVDEVIDIATLTGAVIVSLGNNITGVMGNNQEQIDKFIKISKDSCENTWQMPILEEMKDNLKSEIADMKNTGGRNAGTSTAAWFLSNFTNSKSWLHLDIAGTAYLEKSNKETSFGSTGVMIRSLINYILS